MGIYKSGTLSFVALLFSAAAADAGTLYVGVVYPNGIAGTQWQIFAAVSIGDNGGIYSVSCDINGATPLGFDPTNTGDSGFESPVGTFVNGTTVKQFSFTVNLAGPQANPAALNPKVSETVATDQGSGHPSGDYLYGVGQGTVSTGSLTPPVGMTSANLLGGPQSYSYPILLFQGEKPAGGFVLLDDVNGNLFKTAGEGLGVFGANIEPANFDFFLWPPPPMPEPASLALLGLGGLALIRFARRSAAHRHK